MADDGTYGGVIGAFAYARRQTRSRLCYHYVGVARVLTVLLTVFFLLAFVRVLGATSGIRGGTFTFLRALYVFAGVLVVAPIFAPVLFVARRHRRGRADPRYDQLMGALGFVLFAALYAGLVISMPECFTLDGRQVCPTPPPGLLGTVVGPLYEVPDLASVVPPAVVTLAIYLLDRTFEAGAGPGDGEAAE